MRVLLPAILFVLLISTVHADETWRLPLFEKDRIIEEGIVAKHNILGLYPSLVQIPEEGQAFDLTTTNPFADVAHAVCWTSNHLAGASYRYAYLKKSGAPADQIAAAKQRADELFEAVYRCQRVTGVRGLQARGYFLGHGETYEERHAGSKRDEWHQATLDGQDFRWLADPSHHNYSDAIHGLGQYYDLAAEGEQKDRCRDAIDALVSYWVDNDLVINNFDGRPVPILGMTDGKTLNMRIMMAIAGAKVAHHATGDAKFKTVYDRLIDQFGLRTLKKLETEKNFDDAEHVICHLDNLFRIEDDPELLAAYRVVADAIWANHVDDAQSLFTYIYFGIAPDAPGKEKALQEALYSLQTFPTDMTMQPRMNSIRKDAKPPYPVYAAAWDNEYLWKGNLLRADGWLSRIVQDVAVSPEDSQVLYAVENGSLYQSRDGAATAGNWRPIDQALPSPAKAVAVGQRSRILYVAAQDGFYLSITGGARWERMPVPGEGGAPVDILTDPANTGVLYAVSERAVYRGVDFGVAFLGKTWEPITEGLPQAGNVQFTLALDESATDTSAAERRDRIYALIGDSLFTRRLTEDAWTRAGRFGYGEYARTYPWLAANPVNPDHVVVGMRSEFGDMGANSLLQESTDAGMTWSNSMETLYAKYSEGGMLGIMSLFIRGEITEPVFANGTLVAGSDRGALVRTEDSTWKEQTEGLDIPVVQTVFAPRNSDWIFTGTPAGLYVSKDAGQTWESANLVLQFEKNTRRELGGAAFVDAFWRGMWYGFIDDETAKAQFEGE
jgi:photosystem II stability/assembly factor-like uncharacterized protein